MPQHVIPVMQFRGGSSKGLFFRASDLPADETERNRLILAAMEGVGSGDPRQIDGLGGATSLTSKVAVVSRSDKPDADLDYLFLQVVVGAGRVSADQNCGNMLAAVLPFAIESGLFPASSPTTSARINMVNSGGICEVTVHTPGGVVEYAPGLSTGFAKVDGVPGLGAPILCNYLDIAGSTCGALLPTGRVRDVVDGIEVTCIDNGMPEVILRAEEVGVTGYESPAELEANERLKQTLERIRQAAGPLMNLGDVTNKTVPKMCLISPPAKGGMISTRTFIPHRVHEAIGVLGAISTATACLLPGSVAEEIAVFLSSPELGYSVEHPTGEFTVLLNQRVQHGRVEFGKSGVVRTARLLSRGEVLVPVV
ncbi:4-oxalomesaconate tautomerase [Spirosoma aerophilum]